MNVGVMRGAVKIYAQICLLFCIFLFAQLIVPYRYIVAVCAENTLKSRIIGIYGARLRDRIR